MAYSKNLASDAFESSDQHLDTIIKYAKCLLQCDLWWWWCSISNYETKQSQAQYLPSKIGVS